MTSQLNVDTIVDKAGSGGTNVKMANTSTYVADGGSATQNTVQGLAKAWNNTSSDGTVINDSFNIASLTDVGTGQQQHNVTNSFSNATYVPTFSVDNNQYQQWTSDLTTANWRTSNYSGSSFSDMGMRTVAHGDLA